MKLERFVRMFPGYDCVRRPCGKNGCGSRPGDNHGVHSDTYIYVVRPVERPTTAMTLSVFSDRFPASVPRETLEPLLAVRPGLPSLGIPDRSIYPMGADLSLHTTFYVSVRWRYPQACQWVVGGTCRAGAGFSTSLGASEMVRDHFDARDYERPPEDLWLALEERWEDWSESAFQTREEIRRPPAPLPAITARGGIA